MCCCLLWQSSRASKESGCKPTSITCPVSNARDVSFTVAYHRVVTPSEPQVAPLTAAAVATFMELPVAFAVAIGAFTRPAAVLMFFYTLGTALIGHRYWTNDGCGSS